MADVQFSPETGEWERGAREGEVGVHQLDVTARHALGGITSKATSRFSIGGDQYSSSSYDLDGKLTLRSVAGRREQRFTWDVFGNLTHVSGSEGGTDYYNWYATYDPAGRRLTTRIVRHIGGVTSAEESKSTYDPLVEFLEIAKEVGAQKIWKVYGPDLTGVYGGGQGVGGLEAVVDGTTSIGVVDDLWGNLLAKVLNGTVTSLKTSVVAMVPGPEPGWRQG